jgi:hypothetical protein
MHFVYGGGNGSRRYCGPAHIAGSAGKPRRAQPIVPRDDARRLAGVRGRPPGWH